MGSVARRWLLKGSAREAEELNFDVMALNCCFSAGGMLETCGAGIAPSELCREGVADFVGPRSVGAGRKEHAMRRKGDAAGALMWFNWPMTTASIFWLSCRTLLPSSRSRPWNSKPNPERTRSSSLFKQNEKVRPRSVRSCKI